MTCTKCGNRLDPVWVEAGVTEHVHCKTDCEHGEMRGPRYCALCRHADPSIMPPEPPERRRKRRAVSV